MRYPSSRRVSSSSPSGLYFNLMRKKLAMNRRELERKLAETSGCSLDESKIILDTILEVISHGLKDGKVIELRGLGTFKTVQRGGRMGMNPRSGKRCYIPRRKGVSFKLSRLLFDKLNRG